MRISSGGIGIDLDLVEARSVIAQMELDCGIGEQLNGYEGTVRFLRRLSAWLALRGLPNCTLSGAWQLWLGVTIRIQQLAKLNRENAELAFWFKVDPFKLSDDQKAALLANLSRVKSQDILHSGNYSPTDYHGVYQLTLDATGDERLAQKAKADALERFVDSQIRRGIKNG